jgi:hypothetical protein
MKNLKNLKYTEVEERVLKRYEMMKIEEIGGLNGDIEYGSV